MKLGEAAVVSMKTKVENLNDAIGTHLPVKVVAELESVAIFDPPYLPRAFFEGLDSPEADREYLFSEQQYRNAGARRGNLRRPDAARKISRKRSASAS